MRDEIGGQGRPEMNDMQIEISTGDRRAWFLQSLGRGSLLSLVKILDFDLTEKFKAGEAHHVTEI